MNENTPEHRTPLTYALDKKQYIIAKMLVDKGANVNWRDEVGQTILLLATLQGDANMVAFLLDNGAEIEAMDNNGATALLYAASFKKGIRNKLIEIMLKHHANPNTHSKRGESPLGKAIWQGDVERVSLLLKYGADINQSDAGEMPLHIAARSGRLDVIKLFLRCKMAIDILNSEGQSPLIVAVRAGELDAVRLLLKSGAKFDLRDANNKTALDWALENKHHKIVEYLRRQATIK